MYALNERLFLLINASDHPPSALVSFAELVAADVVLAVVLLLAALWVWGRPGARPGLLATVLATSVALGLNQLLGLLWYEPRPFMIGLGHTLSPHVPENSFPSDHATFMFTVGLGLISTHASRFWGIAVCAAGVLVAWARVYLGLHFPIDMLSSAVIAGVCSFGAMAAERPLSRGVNPWMCRIYDRVLDVLRMPRTLFPRSPQGQ